MSLGGKCEPWDSALMPKRKKRFVYTIDRVNIVALIPHTRLKKEKFHAHGSSLFLRNLIK